MYPFSPFLVRQEMPKRTEESTNRGWKSWVGEDCDGTKEEAMGMDDRDGKDRVSQVDRFT